MTDPLVSSQWLFENLNHPNLIILDASLKAITSNNDSPNDNLKIKGDNKQHIPEISSIQKATLALPFFKEIYPPMIHPKLPIPIMRKDHKETGKSA